MQTDTFVCARLKVHCLVNSPNFAVGLAGENECHPIFRLQSIINIHLDMCINVISPEGKSSELPCVMPEGAMLQDALLGNKLLHIEELQWLHLLCETISHLLLSEHNELFCQTKKKLRL